MRPGKEITPKYEGIWFGHDHYEVLPEEINELRAEAILYVMGHSPTHSTIGHLEETAEKLFLHRQVDDGISLLEEHARKFPRYRVPITQAAKLPAQNPSGGLLKISKVHFEVGPVLGVGEWKEVYSKGDRTAFFYIDFNPMGRATIAFKDLSNTREQPWTPIFKD